MVGNGLAIPAVPAVPTVPAAPTGQASDQPRVIHAGWSGQAAWHQTADTGRRRPWVEPAVLQVGTSVGASSLHYYRISHRLTLQEMVDRLENCVSTDDLRAIELGRQAIPKDLENWLAA